MINLLKTIDAGTFALHGYSKQLSYRRSGDSCVGSFGLKDMLDISWQKLVPLLNLNMFLSRHGKWMHKRCLR